MEEEKRQRWWSSSTRIGGQPTKRTRTRRRGDRYTDGRTDRDNRNNVKSKVERRKKSIMAEQNGRSKTTTGVVVPGGTTTTTTAAAAATAGVREFVEGWTLAQTLGEGAYGE